MGALSAKAVQRLLQMFSSLSSNTVGAELAAVLVLRNGHPEKNPDGLHLFGPLSNSVADNERGLTQLGDARLGCFCSTPKQGKQGCDPISRDHIAPSFDAQSV